MRRSIEPRPGWLFVIPVLVLAVLSARGAWIDGWSGPEPITADDRVGYALAMGAIAPAALAAAGGWLHRGVAAVIYWCCLAVAGTCLVVGKRHIVAMNENGPGGIYESWGWLLAAGFEVLLVVAGVLALASVVVSWQRARRAAGSRRAGSGLAPAGSGRAGSGSGEA